MDKNQEFYFNQFKKMFSELDNSKQKMLHEYLEKMQPSERITHAVELGKRYYYQQMQNAAKAQTTSPNGASVQQRTNIKASAPVQSTTSVQSTTPVKKAAPVQKATPVQTSNKVSSTPNAAPKQVAVPVNTTRREIGTNNPKENLRPTSKKKRRNKGYLRAILVAVIAVLLILCGITLGSILSNKLNNKEVSETTTEALVTETSTIATTTEEVIETTPEATATPTPTEIPTPSPVPLLDNAPDLTGKVIVIDPGHQETTDDVEESCASWLSIKKPRCTSGSTGKATGIHEYEYTLELSLVIKSYLEQCGATVYLTRETNDVNMSNQERALFAVDKNPDLFIRIHADGANDSLESGVRVYVPDSGSYTDTSVGKGDILGKAVAEAFGIEFDSTLKTYLYTGLNYANTIRSFQISVGFLTNSDDETALLNEENQINAAQAIAEFANIF